MIREYPTSDPVKVTQWEDVNVRISPDESRVAMGTLSGRGVELREPATGKLLYSLLEETGSIWWLAWSPDSQRLAVSRANPESSATLLDESSLIERAGTQIGRYKLLQQIGGGGFGIICLAEQQEPVSPRGGAQGYQAGDEHLVENVTLNARLSVLVFNVAKEQFGRFPFASPIAKATPSRRLRLRLMLNFEARDRQ
jgi:hypothetical protein